MTMLPRFSYVRPRSLDEAVRHLSEEGSLAHAGGSDLLGCLREHVLPVEKVVSISGLEELKGIAETPDGGLRLGALTTIAEVAAHPLVRERYAGLAQGASEVASPQLRNQGTLGGNLCQKPRCWYYRGEFQCLRKGGSECFAVEGENAYHCVFGGGPCYIVHPSDTAPNLVALGATIHLTGPRGSREVPAGEFFLPAGEVLDRETVVEPGEIVVRVVLPPPPPGLKSSYRKVRARRSWDFALAGLALALNMENGRVKEARAVLSGAAPMPWRSQELEHVLQGSELDGDTVARAARAAVDGARPLEQNGYKVPLFQGVVEEELLKAAG